MAPGREGELKQRHLGIARVWIAVVLGTASAVGVAAFAPALASGSGEAQPSTANKVLIEGSKTKPLHFVYPKTIVEGESLTIENTTKPKEVGPHTFSMVIAADQPQTKKERKACFTPHHICKAVAGWHKVKGQGPPNENPAKAGKPGWDTEGSLSKKGDSWFTGEKPGAKFTQKVTADTSNGPTTLTFMCVIHPWMHGSIEVLPAG
jgi:hypothetical protein